MRLTSKWAMFAFLSAMLWAPVLLSGIWWPIGLGESFWRMPYDGSSWPMFRMALAFVWLAVLACWTLGTMELCEGRKDDPLVVATIDSTDTFRAIVATFFSLVMSYCFMWVGPSAAYVLTVFFAWLCCTYATFGKPIRWKIPTMARFESFKQNAA